MTPDDPILTAYALNEHLSNADRERIEAAIASDPALQTEVEAIRATASKLTTALATEPAVPVPQLKPLVIRRRTPILHLAAASVAGLLIGGAGVFVATQQQPPLDLARIHTGPTSQPQSSDAAMEEANESRRAIMQFGRGVSSNGSANGSLTAARVTEAEAQFDPGFLANNNRFATFVGGTVDRQSITGAGTVTHDPLLPSSSTFGLHARPRMSTYSLTGRNRPLDAGDKSRIPISDWLTYPSDWPSIARSREETLRRDRFGASPVEVDSLLARKLPEIRFEKVLVPDAINFLRDVTEANVVLDEAALASVSKVQINVRARDVYFYSLLDTITTQPGVNLKWKVHDGAIVIASPETIASIGVAQPNTETYAAIYDNPFVSALAEPLSTFSVDVDTASYANVRRFLQSNQLPPADAVRIEELVNYFPYDYAPPAADEPSPFRANVELADCPWNSNAKLLRVALKGKEIAREARPPSNLVFLIDVSGSMQDPNKLPLVKQSLAKLVHQLDERDSVSIVVYAGASGLALPPTRGNQKATILNAINELTPGGSTNGAAGIELAYQLAVEHFLPQGTNRVMLLTDGDFNVGISDRAALVKLIEEKAKTKVYLSVLGFGTGNLKDATMEELAGKGNGNAAYIDGEREAQKVLVEQMSGTLVTIAKDVKLQLEFNPRLVKRYRLIGYENRMLQKQDFNDDKKDAGDIGAGHAVTALYEIEPVAPASPLPAGPHPVDARGRTEVDPLRYQSPATLSAASSAEEIGTLKLRYKAPNADAVQGTSVLIEVPIPTKSVAFDQASTDFRFASSVAGFGMLMRGSPHRGSLTWPEVAAMAKASLGEDRGGYRAEFLTLVEKASVTKRE